MKIVIVEDEKAAVRNLRSLLKEVLPLAEIVAELDSITDAQAWFSENSAPDLVFMDIHLSDGSVFELLERIRIDAPIIFTTAYDEYALRAFKVNSVDYLLKPIGKEDIALSIEKLNRLQHKEPAVRDKELTSLIQQLKREEGYHNYFLIPVKGDKLIPLSTDMILYFQIQDGVVKAVLADARDYVIPYTLDELELTLNPQSFFRVNRQCIIARKAVKDIDLWFNSRLSLNLVVPSAEKIVVSKVRVTEFKTWFSRG